MNLAVIQTIFRKELVDMLRDKRTLIAMIVLPVLLYPALFLVVSEVYVFQLAKIKDTPCCIAIRGAGAALVVGWFDETPMLTIEEPDDPERALLDGSLHAVIVLEGNTDALLEEDQPVPITVQFDETAAASRRAVELVTEVLLEKRDALLEKRLEGIGLASEFVEPIRVERQSMATPARKGGTLLGLTLPVLMVVMLSVGAFYPAIDLTAGEKERGTFETLLSTPVTKFEIVSGKYLTVFCLSMFAGLMNLGSMLFTFVYALSQIPATSSEMAVELPPQAALLILITLVPLALFISAVMMSVAVFARSFKEAQNFMTPFFVIIMLPAFLAVFPDIHLTRMTQLIPIANASLLFKDLLIGKGSVDQVFAVLMSTGAYAALALVLATWIFQREEIIFAEKPGIPFTLRRAEFSPRNTPTPGLALFIYLISLLLTFYIGSYLQTRRLFAGLFVTEWALILIPALLILSYTRVNLREALSIRNARPTAWLGAILTGIAAVILLIQFGYWQNRVFPLPDQLADELTRIFDVEQTGVGVPALLFFVAFSPAVCEEVLFRGALLSGFRRSLPPWATWLVVGILFGIFHLSVYRMIVPGLFGIVLTYIVWRTGSLLPGVIVHFLNNGAAVLITTETLPDQVRSLFDAVKIEQQGLPAFLLLAAACIFFLGVGLMESSARSPAHRASGAA